MSELIMIRRDDGALERLKVGDANSPVCYRVVCSCRASLGVLASFVDRGCGLRVIKCGRCAIVTVVHGSSIVDMGPWEQVRAKWLPGIDKDSAVHT